MVVTLPFTFSVIPFYTTKDGHSVRRAQPKGKESHERDPTQSPSQRVLATGIVFRQLFQSLHFGTFFKVRSKGGPLENTLGDQSHQDNISEGSHLPLYLLSQTRGNCTSDAE